MCVYTYLLLSVSGLVRGVEPGGRVSKEFMHSTIQQPCFFFFLLSLDASMHSTALVYCFVSSLFLFTGARARALALSQISKKKLERVAVQGGDFGKAGRRTYGEMTVPTLRKLLEDDVDDLAKRALCPEVGGRWWVVGGGWCVVGVFRLSRGAPCRRWRCVSVSRCSVCLYMVFWRMEQYEEA